MRNITNDRGEALPAFGPTPLHETKLLFPFLTQWKVTGPLERKGGLKSAEIPRDILKIGR